ncbi:MAG: YdgA family protein [Proteobacteria bacterium]|nr:YdgA family protein [Pseudomonadota bacterium]
MKKIIIGVVVILGIALLAVPFGSGLVMERIVREALSNLNAVYAKSGHDVSAEIVRYDRGYSSTEIEWKIKFGRLKALYGVDEVIFIDRAEHGISSIVSKTSLEKNGWYKDFINNKLAGKDPLHITTNYKLAGGVEVTTAIDTFAIQVENKTFAVKPGKVVVDCDKEFKKFNTEASWEGLAVAEDMSIGGISMKSVLTMISPYIWDGNVSMVMQNMQITEGGEAFDLANLKVEYFLNYDKEQKKLSAKAEYGVDSINFGPDKITKIFARIGINGVDAKGYEEFMKLYTATVSAILGDVTAAKDDPEKMKQVLEQKMAMVGFQMVAAGEKLLTKGLELKISDIHVQLPDGEITGDVAISLKKDMTFSQFIPVVNQPALVLEIISLKSNATLPEKLVGDAPMLFTPVYPGMQTGLFVKNGQEAQHKAETRDGKLFLNDKELVLK